MKPNAEEIEQVFAKAIEKPAGAERDSYMASACEGNPELREQVETLLRAHAEAGRFLPKTVRVTRLNTAVESAGMMIGRYKLLEPIGQGGFGTVWMAEQQEPVRRRVALKVIKAGMDTEQVLARFEGERQALALMDHPGIARVFDGGATGSGRPYFVMELVRGERITDYCDANKLPMRERLKLFIQVCQAVQHAHQKGVIHRDLKPSNILVTEVDGVATPKIIDFGIAKATQARLTERTLFTGLHQIMGTPAYMSPEQAGLGALDVDTRSDIYALGVLLYELLTGQPPITRDQFEKAAWDEVIRLIREQEPPKPSTRLASLTREELTSIAAQRKAEPLRLNRLVSGDLDWIVMKCLEKDRRRRYETANGLASDLARHLGNEPVLARPPTRTYRLQKAWQRNRAAFATAILFACVLLAATAVSLWLAVRASRAEALARKRLVEAESISKFLTGVAEAAGASKVLTSLAISDSDLGSRGSIAIQQEVLTLCRKVWGDGNRDTIQAMNNLGLSYEKAGQFGNAKKLLEEALAIIRKKGVKAEDIPVIVMYNLANVYDDEGDLGRALKLREESVAIGRRLFGLEGDNTLLAMNALGRAYMHCGRWKDALDILQEGLPACKKVKGPGDDLAIQMMCNLAICLYETGNTAEAVRLADEALSTSRKYNGVNGYYTLSAMYTLADLEARSGRREEAGKFGEEMVEILRGMKNPGDPETLRQYSLYAWRLDRVGCFEVAIELCRELVAAFAKAGGAEDTNTLFAREALAQFTYDAGRWEEALKLREEELPVRQKVSGPESADTLRAMGALAESYDKAGRAGDGLKLLRVALATSSRLYGPESPGTLELMNSLAWQLATSTNSSFRDGAAAVKLAEKVVASSNNKKSPSNSKNFEYMDTLAAAYAEAGQFDKAVATQKDAMSMIKDDKQRSDFDTRLKLYEKNIPCREP